MGFWRIFLLGALMAARPMARKAEAFSGRCVDGPDDVVDVLLAVLGEIGLSREVASEHAVGVLDGVGLPG